jgi:uncharacterized damage-inducible protein DinB
MSKFEIVKEIFDHNEWANLQILDAAGRLSAVEVTADRGPDCGSLQDILMHMLGSHVFMLMVTGNPPPELAKVEDGDVSAIRTSFERVHERLEEMVGSSNEVSLHEKITLQNPDADGQMRTWQRKRWQVLVSVGTHGMQHRGEAALILTSLGHSPGEIDYSYWSWRTKED